YVQGMPVTGNGWGAYQSAFVTLYPLLLESRFVTDPDWQAHIEAMDASFGAWTDDHGPKYMTVFSAGTTKAEWGGYHADDLGSHLGDITTFPSLMAFGATGTTHQAVGAYQAYRRGARQTWATGASMLYRRSDVDRTYAPNAAGLPDVVLGALGLAELREPGILDALLRVESFVPGSCAADLNEDGVVDVFDVVVFLGLFEAGDPDADVNGDGVRDIFDVFAFLSIFDSCT
ncbi:MAG: hypothetical protein KDA28_13020, partial [Phycisphaerales bacterium]|nr:hypothetical protein [Phycisphaerales bacterium]